MQRQQKKICTSHPQSSRYLFAFFLSSIYICSVKDVVTWAGAHCHRHTCPLSPGQVTMGTSAGDDIFLGTKNNKYYAACPYIPAQVFKLYTIKRDGILRF